MTLILLICCIHRSVKLFGKAEKDDIFLIVDMSHMVQKLC